MADISFNKDHMKKKNWIRLRSHELVKEENVVVESEKTGVSRVFLYDQPRTEEFAANHEWWDGEESHRIYNDIEGYGITLELWSTPYDQ